MLHLLAAALLVVPTTRLVVPTTRVPLEPDALFGQTQNWRHVGRAHPSTKVTLTLVLRPEDPDGYSKLEDFFWEVSNPDALHYGAYMSAFDVAALVHAAPSVIDEVMRWLVDEHHASQAKLYGHNATIEATLDAANAERLLATRLFTYEHKRLGATVVRCGEEGYTVPAHLASAIQLIEGVTRLPSLEGPRRVTDEMVDTAAPAADDAWPTDCGTGFGSCGKYKVTPAVLAQRYSLPPAPVGLAATNGSTLAVAEFQGQVWDQKDLDKFASTCSGSIKWNVTVDHEAGRIAPGSICKIPIFGEEACGEALLDIEYAKAVGGDIPLTDVYASNYNLLKWANDVAAMSPLPLVHSVSYGNDERQQTSAAFMLSVNQAVMKLGVQGVSVLFASGDQGVCGRTGCGFGTSVRYHPDFPAASPYVTAVGGTDFLTKNVVGEETAWPDGGGGFSDTFAIPSYQADAVAAYKKTAAAAGNLPPAAYWNATGRGYPDISALAGEINPYCIAVGSTMMGIAGTSAAAPVAAAIVARLNAIRLGKGGKPLGFLNPFLYKNAAAFNDVTHGVNDEHGTSHGGFTAVPGWDPATGLGTPNFAKLAELV